MGETESDTVSGDIDGSMDVVTVSCNVDDGESDTTVVGVEDWYNVDGGAVGGTRQRNNL